MAIGTILGAAGGILGGLAGAQGSSTSQTTTRQLAAASAQETAAGNTAYDALAQLQSLIGQGPGTQAITDSNAANSQLAALLQQYVQSGGVPTSQQQTAANQYAQSAFASQQNALNNTFEDQRIASSRNAARLGRSSIDPVLQNKLLQEQSRQQGQLNSDMTSFGAQYANQLSQNSLNYAGQYQQLQAGLASQALANRQTLLSLGQQLRDSDRNFRANTATTTTTQTGGGGLAGAISGALTGAGAGLSAGSSLGSFNFGNIFGSSTTPTAASTGTAGSGLSNIFGSLA